MAAKKPAKKTTEKPIDPDTLAPSWSLQRVYKPTGKLYPGPSFGQRGDWGVQLFMDSAGCLYERLRTIAYEKRVERWFAISSFEATPCEMPTRANGGIVAREEKRQSRSERAAETRRQRQIGLRYSIDLQLGDLVDEIGFAITEGLFDDGGQRVLRRVIKRVMDARMIFYQLDEPPPNPRKPTKQAEFAPTIVPPTTKTIH